jgi:hypothetical protein
VDEVATEGASPTWVAATSALKAGGFDYKAVGVGDVTGDAIPDILPQNEGDAGDGSILAVTNGDSGPPNFMTVAGPLRVDGVVDFRVVGVGDINGDGFADVVLRDQLASAGASAACRWGCAFGIALA